MAISRTGRTWILLIVAVILLGAAGFTARNWYVNYRAWHNPKAAPLFGEIEPADGATAYASDVWIRWSSPTAAKGRVLWRKVGSTHVQSSDAGNGQELLAHLSSLSAGSKYEYIVEQSDDSQTRRSSVRTLDVKSGLAFEPVVDQTVEHDYDQSVKLTLRNKGSQPVTVAAKALKQFNDLPSDITGYGSVDVPGQITPNGTLDLRLAVTAADATRDTYEIPVVAAGAYATARFHVRTPKLNIAFKVLSEDPKTLAKTVEIRNNGDVLTDLAVRTVRENQTDLQIQPGVKHARLNSGWTINITVTPILYLEFQSLKAEIEATAAGQSAKFPLEFQAPPDVRLIAFRSASGAGSSCQGGYCTNSPNTCSECPGTPGTGPQLEVASPSSPPEAGRCKYKKCNKGDACKTVKDLQDLIDAYQNGDPRVGAILKGSFAKFAQEFDSLFNQLSADLNCADLPDEVASLLARIAEKRKGWKTLNAQNPFPDCGGYNRPTENPEPCGGCTYPPPEAMGRCQDAWSIDDIAAGKMHLDPAGGLLSQLSDAMDCDGKSKGFPRLKCPELKTLETLEKQAEYDKRLTHALSQLAGKGDDSELSKGLEQTEKNFEKLHDMLSKLTKIRKKCEDLKKFLDELSSFFDAIKELNAAGQGGCDSRRLASGFDHLFQAVGKLGGHLDIPDPELSGIIEIFKNDQDFFQRMQCAFDPECRPSGGKQFKFVDGYIPNCPGQ